MKSKYLVLPVALLWAAFTVSVSAAETLRDDARKAGRTVGGVIHDVGQGAKKVGKEVVQGTKEAGKAVGGAAREGGREFKKAVKGEK